MSKMAFGTGLVISSVIHAWLLLWGPVSPARQETIEAETPHRTIVEVVEIAVEASRDDEPKEVEADVQVEPPAQVERDSPAEQKPPPPEPLPVSLVESARPEAAKESDGDLAGRPDGVRRPMLRIDWGTSKEAARVLEAGHMKLVVLRRDNRFDHEVVQGDGRWRIRRFRAEPGVAYSNGLRIVDGVAAFRAVMAAVTLAGDERLAVLMPSELEELLTAAQIEAARRRGISVAEVHTFGGRFQIGSSGVWFDITRVQTQRT